MATPAPTTPTPAPGVPAPSNTTTSGQNGETSPGNGTPNNDPFNTNSPPTKVKAESIISKLLRPAQTSLYQCLFNPEPSVVNWISQKGFDYRIPSNQELISFSCSEASLPGSSFMTNEITDDYHGVTERHAYRRSYDDRVDFTFYVDHGNNSSYNVLWFFEKWMQYITGEENALDLGKRTFNYRVRFPSDYQTDSLYVNKFERDFKGQYLQYKFMQAYPISINSIPVSYDSSQLLKCTVSFTYTRYLTQRKSINLPFEPLFKGGSGSNQSSQGTQEPGPQTPPGNPSPQDQKILDLANFKNSVPAEQLIAQGFDVAPIPSPITLRNAAQTQNQIRNRRLGL